MNKRSRLVLSLALALVILVLPSLEGEAAENWEKTYMDFLSQGENRIENVRRGNFLNHKSGTYRFIERNKNLSKNLYNGFLIEGIEFVDLLGKSHPQMLVYHTGAYSYEGIFVVYDLVDGRVEEAFRFITKETRNNFSEGKAIFDHFRSKDYDSLIFGGHSKEGEPRLYKLSYDDASKKLKLHDVSADYKGFTRDNARDFLPEGYVDLSKSEKNPFANRRQKFIDLYYMGKSRGVIYHVEDSTIRSKMSDYKKGHRAGSEIGIMLNNEYLTTRVKPVNEGGRILVPFREIFEALGVDDIDWNQKEKLISASRGDRQISLKIGDSQAWVNGEAVDLSVPAKLVRGNTLVPIRFVAEALGERVDWNPEFKTVLINSSQDKIVRP